MTKMVTTTTTTVATVVVGEMVTMKFIAMKKESQKKTIE